jgi:RHS repeat-associated protein
MGGLYRLTVRGETPTAAGTFSFIVHGVEDTSSALALDVAETRTLSGIGATYAFDLSLGEAGPVRLFFGEANAGQLSYRVVDALGNLRQDWTTSAPAASDPIHFPTGTHRIEVRGRNGYAGDFSVQVRLVADPVMVPLALNGSAAYSSPDVTETTDFQFSLVDSTEVFVTFDFEHSGGAAQWRLDRADGQVVSGWTNNLNPPDDPWSLLAGDYSLKVRSRIDTPVDGTVFLHEVVDSISALAPDTPATAEILVPGQEHRYEITALPAGTYLLDQTATDNVNNLDWRIENALGETLLERTGRVIDVEQLVLEGGDYHLIVSGEGAATGFVDFSLVTMSLVETPTTLGGIINDAIVQPGEIRRYSFTAPANRSLSIDRQSSSNIGELAYALYDAVGRELVSRGSSLPGLTEIDLVGGDYVLEVLAEGGATGDYALALIDNGAATFTPSGTAIALDTLIESTISAGAPQQWLLSLGDTTRAYFGLVEGATNLQWTLFDSAGEALFDSVRARFPGSDDRGPFPLVAGDYVVEFELLSGGPSDYAFQVVDAAVTETAINLDEVIDSVPTVPGFRNDYLFNIPAEGRFHFELLQGDSQLRWRLERAGGEPVFGPAVARFSSESQGAFNLAVGDYRLIFEATSNGAPSYQFQIHSVTDLSDALTLGADPVPVNAAMAMPGQTHEYALTIEPGQGRLYVDVQSGNNVLRYSLFDGADRALVDRRRLSVDSSDDTGPIPVEPGAYRLVITMVAPTDSAYALTLHAPQALSPVVSALDQIESWTSPGTGTEQRYMIDLTATSTRAFFDPQSGASNVFATLTHRPSGWQPFSDVNLNVVSNADRGPWSLPPGQYELALRALSNAGEPSWQIAGVTDEDAGTIGIDEVVVSEFLTPGSRLSYSVQPEDEGQALIFDLMSSPAQNRWELIDPVGEAVFGPANANNPDTHDQGPIPLADGVYTLTFSNTENEARDWFFRAARSGAIVDVPEGCAACSALDVVFTFDTSPSMDPVNQAMCDITAELVQVLADDGIPISSRFWGISDEGVATCLTSNVMTELGTAVPGSPPSWMTSLDQCEDGVAGPRENWGPAVAVVAGLAPWDEDAVRLLIPVVDEGSYCGDPVTDLDIESVYFARQIAAQNDVVVSPLLPDIASDPVRAMAGLITVGTGGFSTVADFELEDVLPVARSIAIAACGTAETIAAPEFTDLSPRPGTLLPSGVPLVLSGRVLPVNELRPVLEVEVNGQPSSVLDGSGSFFATIELQPGPNQITISAVEACGPTVLEIELLGAGDETDPWAGIAEVSDLLQAEFSGTTYDPTAQRLLVDVAVRNTGAALKGPILMAVGLDLNPGVGLLNSDGITPNGEPYVVLVPDGEILGSGAASAVSELAFSNPDLESVDFEPRWLLPANQAPHFTSVPTTRATTGRPWAYPARATDGDGDHVTYSLLVAPAGMSLDSGELTWTPPAAGTFDIVLRASDGRGGVTRQSFSVNVVEAGFNAPPIFTSAPVIQAPIGFDYSYTATVTDPDGGVVGFALLSAPTGMTIDPVSGAVSWPNAQPGQHSVIIEADDGEGGQATQSYTLFVGEPATTPPGPAFISTPVAYAAVDTQYRYRYRLSPPDATPTITLAQAPAAMTLDTVARSIEWLPEAADLGPHVIELVAIDGDGRQSTQRFELTVLDSLPNQAPYLTSTPPRSAVVGQSWTYQADAVDPEFEALVFSLGQAPAGMSVDPDSGELSWTPPGGTPGTVTVTLLVTDPEGLAAEQVFDIAVRANNADPVLTSTPPSAVFVGETYTHLFIADDADDDPLTFSLLSGPTGMTLDAEAGWLSWPTSGVAPGAYELEIEVADDWGGSSSQNFTINVVEDSQAPTVAIAVARQPACASEPVQVCLQASDNVGIASRELQLDGEVQNLAANCLNWTPDTPGNISAQAIVTDSSGLTANTSRLLQVADCNDEQKPVVTLFSPDIDGLLLKPEPLVVSIDDNTPEALTWTISIRAGLDGVPQVLVEGTGPVSESEVAMIDPTVLPEGEYWISILGSDGLQTGGIEFRTNVGGGFKPGRVRSATADVIMPLAGTPLTIGRSYDSLDAGLHGQSGGDLGPGWRLYLSGSVQDSVRETSDPDSPLAAMLAEPFNFGTRVVVTKPDGERVGFTFEPEQLGFPASFQFSVNFEADKGVDDELRVVDGTSRVSNFGAGFANYIIPYNPSVYELETPEKVVYVISEEDGLIEVRDALGGILTINDAGIQSSSGLSIDYIRDSEGRVAEVQVPPANDGEEPGSILYGYDTSGNLQTVTDLGGGVTTFQYEKTDYPHHVTAVIDPRGEILTRQIYDDQGRLIALCPADGNSATLEGCTVYEYDVAGGIQTTFDTRGFQTDFVYDEDGLLVLQRDWTDAVNWLEERWIYDEDGNVIENIDRAGGSTISTYDDRGNQLSRREPGGQLFTWTYGECSRFWETATDPLGNTWSNEYNDDCLLRFATDPLGNVTEYQYVGPGLRSAIIDPLDQTWGFSYNGLGLESARTDPLGASNSSLYDNRGNDVSITDRNGQQRSFVTDEGGLLLSENWVGLEEQLNFDYNAVGLVTEEANSDQTLSIDYFPTGRIQRLERTSSSGPDWWVDYLYDGNGNVTQVNDSLGGITEYEYDGLDQLIAITQSGVGVNEKRVEFDLNPYGLIKMIRRYGDLEGNVPGPTTTVEYECESCPVDVSRIEHLRPDGTSIHEIVFTRNETGMITRMVDAEGTHDFVYDGRGWLVSTSHPPVAGLDSGSFAWDGQGNWLSLPGKPGPVSLSYADGDGGHRLLSDGEMAYQYDAVGAVISRSDSISGQTLNLDYDPLGRLVGATLLDNQDSLLSQAVFAYTPSGARTLAEVDGVRRHFVFDGDNVIAALDDGGQLVSRRLQMRALDRALAVDDGSEIQWLLADHNGSVRDVVDTDGQIIAHYAYSPFGEQVLGPAPTLDDPIRFTGREFDIPGGLGFYRARAYAPDIARFLSEDPIEPWHYRYAENNPFRFNDPSGKFAAVSYGLKACDALSQINFILDNVKTGLFLDNIFRAAADGINGDPVDVEAILESIKKQFGPKVLLPCGFSIGL